MKGVQFRSIEKNEEIILPLLRSRVNYSFSTLLLDSSVLLASIEMR